MKKNIIKVFSFIALSFLFVFTSVHASGSINISVPSGENINDDYIQIGETIDMAGSADGDVILGGGNVSFSGNAGGDIIVLGGNVRIKGDSSGDIRVVGGNIIIDGTVEKNVTIVGGSVVMEEDSLVNGNLYIIGENAEIRGEVKGKAKIYASKILFSGEIMGSADFRSNNITLRSDGSIMGDLTYAMDKDFSLENKQIVQGQVIQADLQKYFERNENTDNGSSFGFEIWQFLSLFLLGIVFFKLFRKQAKVLISPIKKKEVWGGIASGLISFLFNPVVILISFITVIGIPIALIMLFVYVLLLIGASTLSPVLVGKMLNGRFKVYNEDDSRLWIDFIIGYIFMEFIGFIPFIGTFFLFFLFLFSFGRINRFVYGIIKSNK